MSSLSWHALHHPVETPRVDLGNTKHIPFAAKGRKGIVAKPVERRYFSDQLHGMHGGSSTRHARMWCGLPVVKSLTDLSQGDFGANDTQVAGVQDDRSFLIKLATGNNPNQSH